MSDVPQIKIETGMTGEYEFVVTDELSTDVGGTVPGRVLATPRLVGVMERTCMLAVWGGLPDDLTCVGLAVNIKHVAPAPVGARCVCTARLREFDDGRKLIFDVEVKHDGRTIGVGTHERRIIERTRFEGNQDSAGE